MKQLELIPNQSSKPAEHADKPDNAGAQHGAHNANYTSHGKTASQARQHVKYQKLHRTRSHHMGCFNVVKPV